MTVERLQNRLNSIGIDVQSVNTFLKKSKAVIAGSIVLEAVLNKRWKGKNNNYKSPDIDFWIPFDTSQCIYDHMFTILAKDWHIESFSSNNYWWNTGKSDYARLHKYVNKIVFAKAFMLKPKKSITPIQFMVLNPGITVKDVIRSFDIECCKVFYDGKKIRSMNPAAPNAINISPKMMYEQTIFEWIRTIKRVEKYVNRGLLFDELAKFNMCMFMALSNANQPANDKIEPTYIDRAVHNIKWCLIKLGILDHASEDIFFVTKSNAMFFFNLKERDPPLKPLTRRKKATEFVFKSKTLASAKEFASKVAHFVMHVKEKMILLPIADLLATMTSVDHLFFCAKDCASINPLPVVFLHGYYINLCDVYKFVYAALSTSQTLVMSLLPAQTNMQASPVKMIASSCKDVPVLYVATKPKLFKQSKS